MSSMNTDHVDIEKVTYFVLHEFAIVRNEKSHVGKGEKKSCTYKITAARSKLLNYENIASTFS